MKDDVRGGILFLGIIILIVGIDIKYLLAIIGGGLITLAIGIWLGIDYYKVFRSVKKNDR
jgi:hypothetical protein